MVGVFRCWSAAQAGTWRWDGGVGAWLDPVCGCVKVAPLTYPDCHQTTAPDMESLNWYRYAIVNAEAPHVVLDVVPSILHHQRLPSPILPVSQRLDALEEPVRLKCLVLPDQLLHPLYLLFLRQAL